MGSLGAVLLRGQKAPGFSQLLNEANNRDNAGENSSYFLSAWNVRGPALRA